MNSIRSTTGLRTPSRFPTIWRRSYRKVLEYCEKSGGAFDITIEPLSSLWNFTSGEAVIPDAADIEADIPKVDYHNLVLSGNTLTFLSPDTTIDLDLSRRDNIADRIKDQLLDAGV